MEDLRNLQQMGSLAGGKFNQYDGEDFILPQVFKDNVKEINNCSITYNKYSAIIETPGNQHGILNIFMPNQWFFIASYFTDFYNELQKYKKYALKVATKERLKNLNGGNLNHEESSNLMGLDISEISKNYLKRFITDYTWWGGAKTIDRGDFYVSPILNYARLVNASQSFVADLCAFLADKQNLVNSIILEEDRNTNRYIRIHDGVSLQQIYYGAPGTGKSHKIKEQEGNFSDVIRTTFHPDSDYSTFVGCYKPTTTNKEQKYSRDELIAKLSKLKTLGTNYPCHKFSAQYWESLKDLTPTDMKAILSACGFTENMYMEILKGIAIGEEFSKRAENQKIVYSFVAQAFTKAYIEAWKKYDVEGDKPVLLVIEEINRGNCAQIFGDLFQLLDRNKEGFSEYPIKPDSDLSVYIAGELKDYEDVPEEIRNGEDLRLPNNLYIWATMNTSDQSLFPIDSAFKRRWEWKYIKIKEGKDKDGNKLDWKIEIKDEDEQVKLTQDWWAFIQKINTIIASMTSSADKQLGYFFCKADKDGVINGKTFVSKVIFYLWNDVFKDYGFEDASLFRYKVKEGEKEVEKDLTFPDFYDEDGEKVDSERLVDFIQKVMDWQKPEDNA